MQTMRNRDYQYLPQLTWLRGIAAIFVIISHTVRSTEEPYGAGDIASTSFLLKSLDLGGFGVALFFALSGATLYISHRNDSLRADTLSFIAKRILRIFPAYLVSMAIFIMAIPAIQDIYGAQRGLWLEYFYKPHTYIDIIKNLAMISDLIGNPYSINPVYWSLPIEFRYYLIFPLALLLLQAEKPIHLITSTAAITSLVLIPHFNPTIPHFFWLCSSFFGGMLVAYIHITTKSKSTISFCWLIPVFAIASIIMWHRSDLPKIPAFGIVHTYNNVLAVLTVFIAINATYASIPSAVKNALSFLGKVSYSIYLYHMLLLTFAFIVAMRIELHGDTKAYFILFTTCITSIPAAAISYKYIEKPFIDFSKKIGRNRTIDLSEKIPSLK